MKAFNYIVVVWLSVLEIGVYKIICFNYEHDWTRGCACTKVLFVDRYEVHAYLSYHLITELIELATVVSRCNEI